MCFTYTRPRSWEGWAAQPRSRQPCRGGRDPGSDRAPADGGPRGPLPPCCLYPACAGNTANLCSVQPPPKEMLGSFQSKSLFEIKTEFFICYLPSYHLNLKAFLRTQSFSLLHNGVPSRMQRRADDQEQGGGRGQPQMFNIFGPQVRATLSL